MMGAKGRGDELQEARGSTEGHQGTGQGTLTLLPSLHLSGAEHGVTETLRWDLYPRTM